MFDWVSICLMTVVQFTNMKLISDGVKDIEKCRHPSALVNHGKEFDLDIAAAVG